RRHEQDMADVPRLMVIGGSKVAAASGRCFATVDPASGHGIAEIPAGGESDADRAVAAAKAALRGDWRTTLPAERGRILYRTAQLIRQDPQRLTPGSDP